MYFKDTTNCFSHLVGVRCKSQEHGQDFWPELKGTTAILVSRERPQMKCVGTEGQEFRFGHVKFGCLGETQEQV